MNSKEKGQVNRITTNTTATGGTVSAPVHGGAPIHVMGSLPLSKSFLINMAIAKQVEISALHIEIDRLKDLLKVKDQEIEAIRGENK